MTNDRSDNELTEFTTTRRVQTGPPKSPPRSPQTKTVTSEVEAPTKWKDS